MANIQSPSVNVFELDLNSTVPSLPTSITGFVGEFSWGPCNQIVLVGNDKEYSELFGTPNDTNFTSFFSGWNFLQYGNALKVVRAIKESTAKNAGLEVKDATATGSAAIASLILNDEDAEQYTPSFGADAKLQIFAKYPGAKGNDFSVAIANATDFPTANVIVGTTFASVFDYVPESGQIAIAVLDGTEIVEKYIVSLTENAKDYQGNNIYIEDYINRRSNYILAFNDTSNTDLVDSIVATALTLGVNETPTTGEITTGYDLFDNAEDVDVNIIIDGGNTNATVQQYIVDNILETRKDCIGYFTVERDAVVGVANISTAISNCIAYRKVTLARSTSYAALYSNWKYQYDQYNDKYRWIPLSGDIAGITAVTHYTRDAWFSPHAYNRGKVKNVKKFAINPKKEHRGSLYKEFINTTYRDKDAGFVVLGQKTLIASPSAFNRLDTRWLFVTIERAIASAAKYFIGEKNSTFTRRQFVNLVKPYLRDVQAREGIEAFEIQCDSIVNSAEVVSRNEFVAYIFIKPLYDSEFIKLFFVNVKGSVSFEEVIKKA